MEITYRLQWVAHLRALLSTLVHGLWVGRGNGVGGISAGARVRGRAHHDSLVYLHDGPLDGSGKRPARRWAHVHHHVAL